MKKLRTLLAFLLVLLSQRALSQSSDSTAPNLSEKDVLSGSVSIGRADETNAFLHFKFRKDQSQDVQAVAQRYSGKDVLVTAKGAIVCRAKVKGVLVDSKNRPVGLTLGLQNMADAKKARAALTTKDR